MKAINSRKQPLLRIVSWFQGRAAVVLVASGVAALELSPHRRPSRYTDLNDALGRLSIPAMAVALIAGGRIAEVSSFGTKDLITATQFARGLGARPR